MNQPQFQRGQYHAEYEKYTGVTPPPEPALPDSDEEPGSWLANHGVTIPIYYHGFGEDWLAEVTADGVDSEANRRAIYMVGANPPPSGAGVPPARWLRL